MYSTGWRLLDISKSHHYFGEAITNVLHSFAVGVVLTDERRFAELDANQFLKVEQKWPTADMSTL